MKRWLLLLCLLTLLVPVRNAFARSSAADRAWIATCVDQLKAETAGKKAARSYCICMHEMFEENEKVSQSDREHMFPPAHLLCRKKAGWK